MFLPDTRTVYLVLSVFSSFAPAPLPAFADAVLSPQCQCSGAHRGSLAGDSEVIPLINFTSSSNLRYSRSSRTSRAPTHKPRAVGRSHRGPESPLGRGPPRVAPRHSCSWALPGGPAGAPPAPGHVEQHGRLPSCLSAQGLDSIPRLLLWSTPPPVPTLHQTAQSTPSFSSNFASLGKPAYHPSPLGWGRSCPFFALQSTFPRLTSCPAWTCQGVHGGSKVP